MSNVQVSSLQDSFLQSLSSQQVQVAIYLVNGIKLQGRLEGFDDKVLMLKSTTSQMIYKHAVSTVVPLSKAEEQHAKIEAKTAAEIHY